MKIKWEKGTDFMDGSPRYSFEGRDPQFSDSDIRIVIYSEREREYSHDSQSIRNYYYGYATHDTSETADKIGRFKTLKQAKEETEKLFHEYCELYPDSVCAY